MQTFSFCNVKLRNVSPTAFVLGLVITFACSFARAHSPEIYSEERTNYQIAITQLSVGDRNGFNLTHSKLEDYPLYPYLEYESINFRNIRQGEKYVAGFIKKYEGQAISMKMRVRWLNQLIKNHRWQKYLDYWDPSIKSARLNCWHLRAMYRTGRKEEALDQVQPWWLQAKSQPKACDPLFKEWIETGRLSQEVAWQRLELAMSARRLKLARYIVRKLLTDDFAVIGSKYIQAHRRPEKLFDQLLKKPFSAHPEKMKKVVLHGIKRLTKKNVEKAEKLWSQYLSQFVFSEVEQDQVAQALAMGHAINHTGSIQPHELEGFSEAPAHALEQRIRVALKESDWPSIFYLIQLLPEEKQSTARWQYWLARSIEAQHLKESGLPNPKEIYKQLATKRTYYGFLAADLINSDYAMQDNPAEIPEGSIERLSENRHMIRALELFALEQIDDARREWRYAAQSIDSNHLLAAGKLAENFNWYEKAIRSYIKAQYWNDLKTRFPLAYKDKVLNASKAQQLDSSWLYAIARQESAFSPDARSHAGAMGLMQLMPSTAKQTAKLIGLKQFKRKDLLKPETNIHLGSNYLKGLLTKFNDNRILATTAYNAGPHRVQKWLKESKSNLPFDVWIETIPFKETRSYVQNVLAFSVIYDYRMERKGRLVTENESRQLL